MPAPTSAPIQLIPSRDIDIVDAGFVARGPEPWLDVHPVAAFRRGAIVELAYSAGLTGRVARPLLQFRARDGRAWSALLAAPSEGAGYWRGRVPPETAEIRISPTDAAGPFDFRIESVRTMSSAEMMRLRAASPRRGFFATGARMVRLRDEADLNLRYVLERAETQDFDRWRGRRRRPAEATGQAAGSVQIFLGAAIAIPDLESSCNSLLAQTHLDWRLVLAASTPETEGWTRAHADPRIAQGAAEPDGFSMFLTSGDRLAPHALAALLAEFARRPECDIVYSDEVRSASGSEPERPIYKPDWSPTRQAFAPYVGRAALLRSAAAARLIGVGEGGPDAIVDAALALTAREAVGHVPRLLVETVDSSKLPPRMFWPKAPSARKRKVTIIIPTRDKIDMMSRCLDSIFKRTRYDDYDVLVIDNGSREPATHSALEAFVRREPRLSVVRNAMPFNFGALCNFGVAHARGDTIVFLNNDTVVLQRGWIDRMLEFAVQPDIGAVGCKLLYPSGRVQHAGVVLGMGGVAGHFGEGMRRREPGWLGGALAPHECSAVTAACMMVEREKFEAVDGFDQENLPIELNDVDLCLRLNARGWRTICDSRAVLAHLQSATRGGAALRLQRVYRKEREYFVAAWQEAIRNDPCFNPNLSLYDRTPKLG